MMSPQKVANITGVGVANMTGMYVLCLHRLHNERLTKSGQHNRGW